MSNSSLIETLYESIGVNPHSLRQDSSIAHIEIHHNKILGVHLVPGLEVDAKETKNGINAKILVTKDTVIEKPVQICFGMIPETGLQEIILDIELEKNARAGVFAHCTFPFARQIRHEMDAVLKIGPGAQYAYFERHVHGGEGGVVVVPKSKVEVCEGARYQTDFELIRGRVGEIEIDVEVTGKAKSVSEVTARVSGIKDDRISIRETAHLVGDYARGVLTTNIALQDTARAEIYNTLTAHAAYARGHVDCKEIVQGNAVAKAVPIVEVYHPKAHVTHEAAIGSVDSKQLDTLMSRGLSEEDATNLIIEGLLGVPLLSNG
ncbi:MAG TPA: SufD family Fe-S cluster assembly protein [bacterium]|nr:SufD family Fe-S cluster assembly protein [bacterium]HQO34820.1 SufD family Fe-S cluster assembly protein [bacterium]HQQ01056.1 SufD family Fe-S cluster assembly protein [bacterium]